MRSGSQTTLGEIAAFEMGQAPPGVECNKAGKGTVFVKAGEFASLYPEEKEWTTRPLKFGKRGDVFICVVGATAGKLNLGIDCAIGRSVAAIRPNEGINTKFVYYQLQPHVLKLRAASSGSAQGVISKTQLQQIPILVVPLDQQKLLVAEIEKQFSRLDESVANLKRVKANLKRYKASVLKAAVEGKLTEDWRKQHPNVEPASKLLERILAERRAKWNGRGKYKEPAKPGTNNLPSLPEKWTWATVDQLTSMVTSGSRGWRAYYSDTDPLFIRAQDIKTDSLNLQTIARVSIPKNTEGTRTAVTNGDILITITGANVTKSALVKQLGEQAFVSQHVALLKPSLASVSTYLFTWVVSPAHGRKMLERWAYGAGKPGLSLDQVRGLPVALPPLAEQNPITAEVERRLSVIEELEAAVQANLTRADRLRQAILARAFHFGCSSVSPRTAVPGS